MSIKKSVNTVISSMKAMYGVPAVLVEEILGVLIVLRYHRKPVTVSIYVHAT